MKFLILTQYFFPEIGAAQTRLSAMTQELMARGHEIEIVTAFPNYPQGRIFDTYKGRFYCADQHDGMRVHRLWVYACNGGGVRRIFNYLSFSLTSIIGLLKARKPDFVFVESPPLFLSIPGIIFSRIVGARCIFNVADLWPDSVVDMGLMREGFLIRLARMVEKWAYRNAAFVIAMTEGIRNTLLNDKKVPREKVLFLPNGVDLQRYRMRSPDLNLKKHLGLEGAKVVLYQGTQGYAHGLEAVLRTADLMRDNTDIHFLFVGNGSERKQLEALKDKLQLANVTFLGSVPISELPRFFSIAECGLVSLKNNPLFRGARPAKCNPVFASAIPVVFFGEGEGADLIKAADAGIVVPSGEIHRLAAVIRHLIGNPELKAKLGGNGRLYAEEHLGWSKVVSNWLSDLLGRSTSISKMPGASASQSKAV